MNGPSHVGFPYRYFRVSTPSTISRESQQQATRARLFLASVDTKDKHV